MELEFDFYLRPGLTMTRPNGKRLEVGNTDRDGDIELEIENEWNESTNIYISPEQMLQLHKHLTEQIERLRTTNQLPTT